jgi:hypothetical protein
MAGRSSQWLRMSKVRSPRQTLDLELDGLRPEAAPDEEQLLWAHIDSLCQLDENADVVEPALRDVLEEAQRKDVHATRVLKLFVWPVALLSAAAFLGFVTFAVVVGGPIERNVVIAVCASLATLIQNMLSEWMHYCGGGLILTPLYRL